MGTGPSYSYNGCCKCFLPLRCLRLLSIPMTADALQMQVIARPTNLAQRDDFIEEALEAPTIVGTPIFVQHVASGAEYGREGEGHAVRRAKRSAKWR